jgi:hypothetical protein
MKILNKSIRITFSALRSFCTAGCLCVFVLGFSVLASEQAVKIAVIADKGLESYADLLTVELSKQNGLNVIERTEIERVMKEQEISNANLTADYLRLGKLLKADGMVIIKKFEFMKKKFLVSRLVAVNQGAVLSAFANPFPMEMEKIEGWSSDVFAKFAPYLNKVGVSQEKAVPISILNVRAPIDTPEMRMLEKEFTLALAFRLIQEKDLFILERWKMEKLVWEKDLDADSFWTGSYLLDGSIEPVDKDNVKVKLRLRKAGGEEKTLEATGTRQELSEITEKITAELLKNIGKTQNRIPWDSAKEAEEYLKEARWALNSGLYADALTAVDSAWALGDRSPETLLIKIHASAQENKAQFPMPKVTKWSPTQAPSGHGFEGVVFEGDNFTENTCVLFGMTPSIWVRYLSRYKLEVKIPKHAPGKVRITVSNGPEKTIILDGYFEFIQESKNSISFVGKESSEPRIIVLNKNDSIPLKIDQTGKHS